MPAAAAATLLRAQWRPPTELDDVIDGIDRAWMRRVAKKVGVREATDDEPPSDIAGT